MFYIYHDGDEREVHDHYILSIKMDSCTLVEEPYEYCCEGGGDVKLDTLYRADQTTW